MESLRGKLLVAGPTLPDPNFARTVILVLAHGEEGAVGLVLNRPSETEVADAVPAFAELGAQDDVVHVGGPVQPGAVLAVAEVEAPELLDEVLVGDSVGLVTADLDADALAGASRRARVYAGYAGWGPGQLDGELEREDWIVTDPVP